MWGMPQDAKNSEALEMNVVYMPLFVSPAAALHAVALRASRVCREKTRIVDQPQCACVTPRSPSPCPVDVGSLGRYACLMRPRGAR